MFAKYYNSLDGFKNLVNVSYKELREILRNADDNGVKIVFRCKRIRPLNVEEAPRYRTAIATLNKEYIAEEGKTPKGYSSNTGCFNYFDIDRQDWRCIYDGVWLIKD